MGSEMCIRDRTYRAHLKELTILVVSYPKILSRLVVVFSKVAHTCSERETMLDKGGNAVVNSVRKGAITQLR